MSYVKIILSDAYQRRMGEIEDFIWESSGKSILAMEAFLSSHDNILEFLKQNPTTPAHHPQTGDQSWPFADGLLGLIDNRMSNLKIYPNNFLPTYNEDK